MTRQALLFDAQLRKLKRDFRRLILAVTGAMDALDAEMKQPTSPERGKRIGHIVNAMNLHRDIAEHFGLGLPLGKHLKRKPISQP